MPAWIWLLAAMAAEPQAEFTSPRDSSAEYGYTLTAEQAREGWISLFDGESPFGWHGGKLEGNRLVAGETTSRFCAGWSLLEVVRGGQVEYRNQPQQRMGGAHLSPGIRRGAWIEGSSLILGLKLKSIKVRFPRLESLPLGKDLAGWKAIPHPNLPADMQTRWEPIEGGVRGRGGPGALELLDREYGDFVLQMEVRTGKLTNGGIFFRAIPGDFMNGYEAQVFNACYDGDPAKPARYSTGALDDRQLARRLVSRDGEWFTYTIVAVGPHIATWINGYQLVDFTDTRLPDDNARRGLRIAPGAIQLQAHDPDTEIEFRNLRIAEVQ